jgi:DNA primase
MTRQALRSKDRQPSPIPGNVYNTMVELGVEDMRENGDEISGRCPMHYARLGKIDRHSSWSVNANTAMFNCFSCGYKGAFALLVRDMLGITWEEAESWIRSRGSIERARTLLYGPEETVTKPEVIDTSKRYTEAHLALFDEPPQWACDERDLYPDAVHDLGILWDTKTDRWILPVRDPETFRLWGWQEKGPGFFRNRPRNMTKSHTLFGIDAFDASNVVLVESPLDVVKINQALDVNAGLASMGASVSDEQIALILERTDRLIIALDNPSLDATGARSAADLQRRAAGRGLTVRFLDYDVAPDCKDPGDMSDDEINRAVDQAYSTILARFR